MSEIPSGNGRDIPKITDRDTPETQEAGDIMRLATAGKLTGDESTKNAARVRALQQVINGNATLDSTFTKVLGLDKIPPNPSED